MTISVQEVAEEQLVQPSQPEAQQTGPVKKGKMKKKRKKQHVEGEATKHEAGEAQLASAEQTLLVQRLHEGTGRAVTLPRCDVL